MGSDKRKRSIAQRALLCLSLLCLASCRLVLTPDGGGSIDSDSGLYDCSEQSCAFPITEETSMVLTAVPAEGYRFVRWKPFCKRAPGPVCELTIAPLPEEFSQFDGDINLRAVFERNNRVRDWYRDLDGDRFGDPDNSVVAPRRPSGFVLNRFDCDDGDADVSPSAEELDDGRDNNCNGKVDEGFRDTRYYLDSDGDGFGDPAISVEDRQQPEGYVRNDRDCDDSEAEDFPGAEEVVDGRDNDCDGDIDEGDDEEASATYYRDLDGDRFGIRGDTIESLEPINGYASKFGDCDDNNADIFPGAEELFDSVDNDCDGVIDEGFSLRDFYRDLDGDGFGDPDDTVQAVEPPGGYVANAPDNCVDIPNPLQRDSDRDGIGDVCDSFTDTDRDEIQDSEDNCPVNFNPDQSDLDEDGLGDACDTVDDRNTSGGPVTCSFTAEDQAMLDAVNAFRSNVRECGYLGSFPAVPALTWSCELDIAAQVHSMDMANNNFFSHTGSDGSSAGDRATRAGYSWSAWGENIAAGIPLGAVSTVVQGWIDSPGHCANMMNASFQHLGSAKFSNPSSTYGLYWTQVFGRPR